MRVCVWVRARVCVRMWVCLCVDSLLVIIARSPHVWSVWYRRFWRDRGWKKEGISLLEDRSSGIMTNSQGKPLRQIIDCKQSRNVNYVLVLGLKGLKDPFKLVISKMEAKPHTWLFGTTQTPRAPCRSRTRTRTVGRTMSNSTAHIVLRMPIRRLSKDDIAESVLFHLLWKWGPGGVWGGGEGEWGRRGRYNW